MVNCVLQVLQRELEEVLAADAEKAQSLLDTLAALEQAQAQQQVALCKEQVCHTCPRL